MLRYSKQGCARSVGLFFIALLLFHLAGEAVGSEPKPSPGLSPADVVRIQVEALRNNRIEIVFRFASPLNKAHTGPLSRFIEMLESSPYAAMLRHRSATFGPLRKEGGQAYQPVILFPPGGDGVGYVFVLSKYYSDACDGCWLTDSVTPVKAPESMRGI